MNMKWIVASGLVISSLLAITLPGQTPTHTLQEFLQKQLAFTASELGAMDKGQIVVRLPKTPEAREVAAFAIMRLDVPSEFFLEKVRDIVNFKKSDNVLQIGKFSNPPRIEDLASLTLDPVEIDTIRSCRINKCDFKMSAAFIERFRKEINWAAPDYEKHVLALMREVVLESVRAYLNGGNTALGEYNDKPYRLNVADEFKSLLQPTPYMYGFGPEFHKYLVDFPKAHAPDVETFAYWSKERFGLKPVITATHIAVHRGASSGRESDVLIASKGIYANHYFEASLGFTAFVHSTVSNQPRTYLIYINRSKTDALRGMFAGFKRSLITGRLRDGAKKSMEMIKQKLESAHSER
jgi:hypothetical protein